MAEVAGADAKFIAVDDYGNVYFADANRAERFTTINGLPPFSVAASSSAGGANWVCIITDATGNMWRGTGEGRDLTQVLEN